MKTVFENCNRKPILYQCMLRAGCVILCSVVTLFLYAFSLENLVDSYRFFYGTFDMQQWHLHVRYAGTGLLILVGYLLLAKTQGNEFTRWRYFAFMLINIFSVYYTWNYWGSEPARQLLHRAEMWAGLLLLASFGFFVLKDFDLRLVEVALVSCAALNGLLALTEFLTFQFSGRVALRNLPWVEAVYNIYRTSSFDRSALRASGAIGNPNMLALLCCAALFLILPSILKSEEGLGNRRTHRVNTKALWVFIIYRVLAVILCIALFLSASRAGMFCFAGWLTVYLTVYRKKIRLGGWLAILLLSILFSMSTSRLLTAVDVNERPNVNRWFYAKFTIFALKDQVFLGKSKEDLNMCYRIQWEKRDKSAGPASKELSIPGLWLAAYAGSGIMGLTLLIFGLYIVPIAFAIVFRRLNAIPDIISLLAIGGFLLIHSGIEPPLSVLVLPLFSARVMQL